MGADPFCCDPLLKSEQIGKKNDIGRYWKYAKVYSIISNIISKTFGLIRSNKSMEPLEKKPAVEKDQLQNESAPKELMQNL